MTTTRTRTKHSYQPTAVYYELRNGGQLVNSSVTPALYEGTMSSISDNNNGKFWRKRHGPNLIFSDATISRSERSYTFGSIGDHVGTMSTTYSGDLTQSIMGGTPDPTIEQSLPSGNSLLLKLFAKIKEANILSGEALSDIDKSYAMLKRPFGDAQDLVRRIRKYRKRYLGRTAMSALKATKNAWLEYRYGWKPIIMDADTAIRMALRTRERHDGVRSVVRIGKQLNINRYESWDPTATLSRKGSRSCRGLMQIDAGVMYEVVNHTTSEELSRNLGGSASSLPATLWEVVPYSFVVDWFTNVGDCIQASSPDPGTRVLGWWVTRKSNLTSSREESIAYKTTPPSTAFQGTFGSETIKSFNYSRSCNQEITYIPELTQASLSVLHSVDALALSYNSLMNGLRKLKH